MLDVYGGVLNHFPRYGDTTLCSSLLYLFIKAQSWKKRKKAVIGKILPKYS